MNCKSIINAVVVAAAVSAVMFVGCGGDSNPGNGGGGGGGGGGGTPTVTKGTFTDSRDSKSYNWVGIGTQKWMAENLDYNASGSECYNNSADSCAKYGRLYNWSTAMNGASGSSLSPSGVQGVCPDGWHLPSDAEWTTLENYVGSSAGKKLKSTSGWYDNGNGTDNYGFSALPGGNGYSGGYFNFVSSYGLWWSATEGGANFARYRSMYYIGESVIWSYISETVLFSVRCVADQ